VAKLDGADLCGADLRDAGGLTAMQVAAARRDDRTRLPPDWAAGGSDG
jgi:hypothetical protein